MQTSNPSDNAVFYFKAPETPEDFQKAFDEYYAQHFELMSVFAYDSYMCGQGEGIVFMSWDGGLDINEIFGIPEGYRLEQKGNELVLPMLYLGNAKQGSALNWVLQQSPTTAQRMKAFYDPRDTLLVVVTFMKQDNRLMFFSRLGKYQGKELHKLWQQKRYLLDEFMAISFTPGGDRHA